MDHKKEIIECSKAGERYYRIKHPSGCTICLFPMEGYRSSFASYTVKYGSLDSVFKPFGENETITVPNGIAHYLEHKMFENDGSNFFQAFGETGANANAYTNTDRTSYLFSCSDKFEENLETLLKCVQTPYFTDETVEKERGIIEQEIKMYEDDPNIKMYYNCLKAVFHNHPMRSEIAGTTESITKIDKELLYRCYNTFYTSDNAVLSIAGCFGIDKTLEICDRMLKKSDTAAPERIIPYEPYEIREKSVTTKMPCSKPIFEIMYKLPPFKGKKRVRAGILYNALLEACLGRTSLFYSALYEQELMDGINAGALYGDGYFIAAVAGKADNPSLVMDKINSELYRLKTDLPKREEFENVKKRIYGSMIEGLGSVEAMANSMTNGELSGGGAFDGIELAASIGYDEAIEALHSLDLDNCSISVVEPLK